MQCAWALVLRVDIANIEEFFAVTYLTFQWYMATWLFRVCVRMLSMVGQWACVTIGELLYTTLHSNAVHSNFVDTRSVAVGMKSHRPLPEMVVHGLLYFHNRALSA